MNQHKFAFRVGVLVLLIAVMAGVFSVRLHNLENVPFFELDNAECIAEFILSDYFR